MTEPARCWLCSGPPEDEPRDEHGGVRFSLTPHVLCDDCWQKVEDERLENAAHDALYHIDNAPTPDCGCVLFTNVDELEAWLRSDDE